MKPAMPQIDHLGVGARLDALRSATDLDKGTFALSFGLDPSSYSKIIKGEKPLKVDMGFACASRWGVSLDYLYRGSLDSLPPAYAKQIMAILMGRNA